MTGSSSKTATTSSQSTNVRNLNLQDTGGFTAADNKNSNITAISVTSDSGAIAAGQNIATAGLSAGVSGFNAGANIAGDAISANTNVANSGLQVAGDLGRGAFTLSSDVSQSAVDLGRTALSAGQQIANAGLDNAAAAYSGGLTFGNNALQAVQSIASDALLHQESLTASALSGYQSIAQQNSASDSTQIQKIALYAIGAAVLLVVLPKVFK